MKDNKENTSRQPLPSLTGGVGGGSDTSRQPLPSLTGGVRGGSPLPDGRGQGVGLFGGDNIDDVILNGVTFKGAPKGPKRDEAGKVKTKAKKKSYITGAHGSAAAKKKADIRRQRANRHK